MPKQTATTPADLLTEVGRALYGGEWANPMARALGITENSLRKLLRGKLTLTPDHGIMRAALQLLDEERVRQDGHLERLRQEAASERRLRDATARRDTATKLGARLKFMIG
jgi:plasmid maintenance system antidote protein VapI